MSQNGGLIHAINGGKGGQRSFREWCLEKGGTLKSQGCKIVYVGEEFCPEETGVTSLIISVFETMKTASQTTGVSKFSIKNLRCSISCV
ncbi:hypothetical protein CEXT_748241 [Caerostris extrusa]|uniref:Uncharacterized protein n=1 Tax=Caerostris extrusa TaxID=172846 RepID=A0AAV4X8X2_CAEEX|nr:hypothetical protein CEXT_748241 [Caerostris extrusa]